MEYPVFGHHRHHHHHRHGARRGGFAQWGPFEVHWEGGAEGRGVRMRRMFDGSELRLLLLKLIEETPRHGYDLIREIEERTGGVYAPSPGVVYPTLTLLSDMGLIEEQQTEGSKKSFAISAAGQAHLAERADEAEALLARLSDLGSMRERTSGGPIRRAMRNLKSVLGERLGRGDVDSELLHEVAAIIDEAVQKIERLK